MDNPYVGIDFRKEPARYREGRGEQGVLSAEPYKSEILPHWRFATPADAEVSAKKIYQMFLDYRKDNDYVGASMARKFILMGYTRSKRYSHYPKTDEYRAGQKYIGPVPKDKKGQSGAHGREQRPQGLDPVKEASAQIFATYRDLVEQDQEFAEQRRTWRKQHG